MLHHCAASTALSAAAFCLPHNYRDSCVSSMRVHICSTYVAYVSLQSDCRESVCVREESETHAVEDLLPPHHCTIPPPPGGLRRGMSGLREGHCAESTGGEQLPRCAACPFGRLRAAFQQGAPPAFGSVSLVDQAFACWSLTRCAHSCLQLVRPLRAADYPTVIGAWALADQRCPADCRALVIFHSLMLCSPLCLFMLAPNPPSVGLICLLFSRHDRAGRSFPCPLKYNLPC